ncbi:alanyl-tRNA editing protein [Haloterrigena salinisoli]|uniref:alanyl-tRNA editing protein n=1 Tax=Haloterrigena salinisoli TaxID=3132747 RepID=UPI0030D4D1C4
MTGQRAAGEPYTTRFETEVTSIDGRTVWLETSYFYGASDGQPADRGTIGDAAVTDVRLVDGEQVHVLAEEPSFRVGQRVLCSIDWSFRMYCMRAHTAGHVCYGAARRCLESPGYAGLAIGEETVGVDLETAPLDDEKLIELDELINRTVWESRPVSWESVPVATARERGDVVFDEERSRTAVEKGRVRVVTIGDENDTGHGMTSGSAGEPWDVAACGGTHVRNTREVGPVTVLGCSSPAEGIRRIEFAVGPRAIDRRTAEKRAAFAATSALDVDLEDVGDELERA